MPPKKLPGKRAKRVSLRVEAPVRAVRIASSDVLIERGTNGVLYARSPHPLGPYPEKLTERLDHWAATAPDRTFFAKRASDGEWQRLTYHAAREQARGAEDLAAAVEEIASLAEELRTRAA